MENKDQNNTELSIGASSGVPPSFGIVKEPPPDPDALSLEPSAEEPLISQEQPEGRANIFLRFARRLDVMLAVLLVIAGAVVFFAVSRKETPQSARSSAGSNFGTVSIPLGEIVEGRDLTLSGIANVTINGTMQLNNGLYLSPTVQPTGARPGQLYFDQATNQLAYFNGEVFVFLTSASEVGVQSLGGAVGQVALGDGLNVTNNEISNSGVLSVQGQNGDIALTAGPGILINGTNFSNSGVISIASGTPNVTVSNDGSGNVTLSVTSGAGTITSSGGTAGTIPLYTASQNIENSIVTQSGLTVTISGDLSVVTGGLTLSNALTVSNGGTGATSFASNGVLVGNGTAAISAVAAGGAGLCLLSTAGAPVWGACPSGSGVTSLNGLAGALSIANASAAGSTITIDDASTTNKGIASFDSTNFNVASGAVNTVQNINTAATPTFAGVNTNTITPSAALTVGVSAQTALLQGSTTTITSNGVGNNIVLNSAATIELQDDTNVTGNLGLSGDIAVNGGDITSAGALNITPGGALTVGASSQALTLQGGATSTFRATSGANTTIIGFTSPTANTTLNFPALAAGAYTICTTSGNCAGAAATLQSVYDNSTSPEIVLDATRGALTIRDNSTPLGANLLEVQNNAGSATYLAVTSSGIAVTGTATISSNVNSSNGALQTNGTARIDNSGNAVNIGSITLSGAISGGTTITGSGDINTTGGGIQTNGTTRIDNSGNLINIAAITASGNATFQGGIATLGTNAQAGTIVLNDGSSNTGTLQVAALGQNTVYTLPDPGAGSAVICLSTGNCAGSGGGVTTGGGTNNRLAKFTGAQAIDDSSISDDGTEVTVSIDVIIQGGDLTLGTTAQQGSILLHDGNGQTTTLQAGDSAGDITFILPTNTGTANQCLKQSGVGNQLVWQDCDGGSGGSSATLQTAYDNSTSPEIVLNSSVGGLTIRDSSTPLGTNLFEIQNNAGSTTYLAVTVSGLSVTGSATASGTINSTGGAIQTNSTDRIDNSGNLVNIGNITGTGAITIASIGAGSDITVDGADQFIVQDASVFNALSTFNANIDLGGNDLVGTTGDINLTNFDLDGATGNITFAGTVNGQVISNAASFTGTLAVGGDTTLTGDIAVNGGDITSTGALNITPNGTLTVGVSGQQLILQGSANTQLIANGDGFTTTVGFNGTATANVVYNFDRTTAGGTYTICTSVGNCAGSGGGVTTAGGTTGTLAKFTGAQTLGDSLLSESGATVTVNGHLNLISGNQFQVNGTQISSANLSNDANLAKLSASQTFTGNTVAFQNTANSTNAFNVQNQGGSRILTIDSTSAQVVLGTASALDGSIVFNNMSNGNTVTILPGTPTADRTLTLPDASGIICTDSGNCAGAGATLQTAYNFSVGGTTPKIKVNSSLLGVDIQDADTTIGANLFNVRASNGAGLGSVMFGVGNTGVVTLQNSANSTAAFRLLTQGGTSVLTGDTTNGAIYLGQGSTLSGTLIFNNATNGNTISIVTSTASTDQTITLPNATGTVCLSSGNCSGAGSSNTLQAAYDAGNTILTSNARDIQFQLADTVTDGNFTIDLQCDTACGANGRFAIQDDGTDVFAVSPAGGSIVIQPTVGTTSSFNIKTQAGNNLFTVDTANSRIGIGMGSNNVPTLAGSSAGLHLQGGLRISGTGDFDEYTTPGGADILAKINVEKQSPGGFSQVLALGIDDASDFRARVISVFDERDESHQPSIAVFSPDENSMVGFNWDGINTDAKVQTDHKDGTTAGIILQSGNVGSSGTSGDVQVSSGTSVGGGSTGTIYIVSGDGTGGSVSTGNVIMDVGTATGAGVKGAVNIGVTNADSILIGRSAGTTTLQGGTTNVSGALNANGNVALGDAAADTLTITATIQGGSPMVFEGGTVDAHQLTMSIASLTGDRTVTFGDEAGTVCLQNSVNCGFLTGAATDYIQNSTGGPQTANFNITSGAATSLPTARIVQVDNSTAGGRGLLVVAGSNPGENVFEVQNSSSNQIFAVDAANTRVMVGSNCTSGRLCVGQSTSGSGSGTTINLYSQQNINMSGGTGTWVNHNIVMTDTSSAIGTTLRGMVIDTSGTTNTSANIHSIQAKIPTNANGNFLTFENGSNTVLGVSNSGAMTLKNTADSTEAFQIQNASSEQLVNVDSSNSIVSLANGHTGRLPSFTSETDLITARENGGYATLNGYLYIFGGCNAGGSATTTVQYAKLNTDGSTGAWSTTTSLPVTGIGYCGNSATVYNGRVYVHGGGSNATDSQRIYYARPNADGTITSWATNAVNGQNATHTSIAAYNGYLYEVGTNTDDLWYAPINADGSVGSFTMVANWLGANRQAAAAIVANGYLYVIGGNFAGSNTVYYGKIRPDGSVGTPAGAAGAAGTTTVVPDSLGWPRALVANGYMYVMGGWDGSSASVDTIYYAPINANGTLGTWSNNTTLPAARNAAFVYFVNGYIYYVGGFSGSGGQDNSWYTALPSVRLNASLNLVGIGGENLNEGGSSGQLTAGNTDIIGNLSVRHDAAFLQDVAVTRNLNVGGEINATAFSGAGLTDCDSINSKLLWDATTKQFSCGSDKPNVVARKAANQTSASTTWVVDPNYTFTVGAGETWAFRITTSLNTDDPTTTNASDTNPEFRMNMTSTAGATCRFDVSNIYNVWNSSTTTCAASVGEIDHGGDTFDQQYVMWGTIIGGGSSSTVTLEFRRFGGTGTITHFAGGFITAYKLTGVDLAEAYYTNDRSIAPGDVVRVDGSLKAGVSKTSGAYDAGALGIVSTQPGHILGDPNSVDSEGMPVLLALSGRIPVKVSLENGPIKPGDYLTTSSTPGVAMKATKPGQMIGKALESFDSENPDAQGTVMTFANLTWADPNTGATANPVQNGAFGDINVSGTVTTKDLVVTNRANINNLVVGTMSAGNVTVTGSVNVAGDINLQGVGKSRNAITKRFVASKHIPIGAVVIVDPINDGQVTTTAVMGDTRVLGVALTEAQAGQEVTVAIGGSVQVKTTTGAMIQGGELLVSSGQEGAAEKSAAPLPGQMIGKALGRNEAGDLVWILISLN